MAGIDTSFLSPFQRVILNDALSKQNGTLYIPMGSGKTALSLSLALLSRMDDPDKSPALIVCPKSLLSGWILELKRFFPDTPYTVLHSDYHSCDSKQLYHFDISPYHIVLATPESVVGHYNEKRIANKLLHLQREGGGFGSEVLYYRNTQEPLGGVTGGPLYSTRWSYFAVDEGSKYLNHSTVRTRALIAISAKSRWLLSGTILSQPSIDNVFGYFLLINSQNTPRNRPEFLVIYKDGKLPKMAETFVKREVNEDYIPEKLGQNINHIIVDTSFTKEEADLFLQLKGVIKLVSDQVKEYKEERDRLGDSRAFSDELRLLTGMLLGFITYIKEALVCPLIPITSMYINMADLTHRDHITTSFTQELVKLNPGWLEDEDSVYSSRLRKVVELINKHPNERVVVFSAYRTTLDVLEHYLPEGRPVHTISGSYSSKRREQELNDWSTGEGSILTLTYEVGGCGLNLQDGTMVIVMDYSWDMDTTKQAVARVVRRGQTAKEIYIYYLTANTGVEKGIYNLHLNKKEQASMLEEGMKPTTTKRLKLSEMVELISMEDTMQILDSIYKK